MSLEDAISKLAHEIALNTLALKENTLVRNEGKANTTLHPSVQEGKDYRGESTAVGTDGLYDPEDPRLDPIAVKAKRDASTKTEEVIQKAKKPTPVKTEETVSSANGASPQSEPETAAVETLATLDYQKDIMPVLTKFFTKCGRDAAAALLKTYGVNKFSEIGTDKLGGLLADLNSGLGA